MKKNRDIKSLLDLIGNTPLIPLNDIFDNISPKVEVYAKAEWLNPGGSVKDRPAFQMIMEGIESGALTKDKIIMDSSSGNTAISYAMIGAVLGYEVELVTPQNINFERKKVLEAYGAKVINSDPLEGSDGAIKLAKKLKKENPDKYFMPDQYNNPANPRAHYNTTAPEIWEQTEGKITHFLAGMGTSGTLMGTGVRLREFNENIKIIAMQPAEPLHGLEGLKHMPTSIVPGIYDESFPDEIVGASTERSYDMMKILMDKKGLFVGHSGGAAVYTIYEFAKNLDEGLLVTVLPDSGFRYLSEGIWW
ncbi:MAG: PLP-dependent cysteine synthase family protein [Thermodesulfobacteriota bacterium]